MSEFDGQFLMNRYYGSDEEVDTFTEIQKHSSKKNKRKQNKSEEEFDGLTVIQKHSPRKHVKKENKSEEKFDDLTEIQKHSYRRHVTKKNESEEEFGDLTETQKHSPRKHVKKENRINEEFDDLTEIQKHTPKKNKRKENGSDEELDEKHNPINNEIKENGISSKKKKKKKISVKTDTDSINDPEENASSTNNDKLKISENLKSNKILNDHFPILGSKSSKLGGDIKSVLPKWLTHPTVVKIDLNDQETPVADLLYLDSVSKKNLSACNINFLFPVQLAVIPWLMQANKHSLIMRPSDLCVSAPTGSGKTLAFVIPIIQSLRDRVVQTIRAVIVLPVSELAIQVYSVFKTFARGTDLKIALLTGQKSFMAEQTMLSKKGACRTICLVDIVVTTPGRILDHLRRTEGFCLEHVRYLVIDEADRMMEEIQKGWLKQIEDAIYKNTEKCSCFCFAAAGKRMASVKSTACSFSYINQPLQKLLYSATLSHDPEKLHTLSLYRPKLFITQESDDWVGKCSIPKSLVMEHIICDTGVKPIVLCHYIMKNNFKKVLCFTESVERSQRLTLVLEEMGLFVTKEMSSNFRPVQRKIILEQFCSGKVNVLVCSDLVARGIDLENVDCVVSYDVPLFLKTYIHRIGRTARAGKSGVALTLATESQFAQFKKMLTSTGLSLPENVPVDAEDLEPYVNSFQSALKVVDEKLRKLKSEKKKNRPEKSKTA